MLLEAWKSKAEVEETFIAVDQLCHMTCDRSSHHNKPEVTAVSSLSL